ncbi:hypothetical protein LX36DRAFT_663574 [Colletotrichum falcatum]|nr:hypothetical protein LX36DRAFT_663574 [Colletotrichum falcatum]
METRVLLETNRTQPLEIGHHNRPENTNRTLDDTRLSTLTDHSSRDPIFQSGSDGRLIFDTASPFIYRFKKSSLWIGQPANVLAPETLRDSWDKPGGLKDRLEKDLRSTRDEIQRDGAGMPSHERHITLELRMSGSTSLLNPGSVTLRPCIWVLCGSRRCKKQVWKAVRSLSWTFAFVHRPIEVHTGGPRLATVQLSVPAVQVRWDQMAKDGIGCMGGRMLHHVEQDDSRIDHMSVCGMLCCTTFARDGHIIEQHLSRIGGILTQDYDVSSQGEHPAANGPVMTTAHGILDLLWTPRQRDQKTEFNDKTKAGASDAPNADDIESSWDSESSCDSDGSEEGCQGLGSRNYLQAVSWSSLRTVVGIRYMGHEISKQGLRNGVSKGADYMLLGPGPLWNFHNTYRSKQGGDIKVAGHATNATLKPGPVSILFSSDVVEEGYLLAESLQLPLWGKTLDVRKVQLRGPLAAGTSGTWLLRDNLFCGIIVARYPWEPFALIITAEDVLQDVRESFNDNLGSEAETGASPEPIYHLPPELSHRNERLMTWMVDPPRSNAERLGSAYTQVFSERPSSETTLSIVEEQHQMTKQHDGVSTNPASTEPSRPNKERKMLEQTLESMSLLRMTPSVVGNQASKASADPPLEPDGRGKSQKAPARRNTPASKTTGLKGLKSSFEGLKASSTVRVWTCCQCGGPDMTTNVLSCLSCYHYRCNNCHVKKVNVKREK